MVPISAFFSRVLPHVLGCPEPTAEQAVLDAAIDFCERTLVVQHDLAPVSLVRGRADYALTPPVSTEVAQVMSAWINGNRLHPVARKHYGQKSSYEGIPASFVSLVRAETAGLQLLPTPNEDLADALVVRVALRPTRSAVELPDVLLNEWADAVVAGALYRLHDVPAQPYTNEAKALSYMQRFYLHCTRAKAEANRGRVVSSMSVNMRSF